MQRNQLDHNVRRALSVDFSANRSRSNENRENYEHDSNTRSDLSDEELTSRSEVTKSTFGSVRVLS